MYVHCCLVEIARKSVTDTANMRRTLSGVGLLFCGGAKVPSSAIIVMADSLSAMVITILCKQ